MMNRVSQIKIKSLDCFFRHPVHNSNIISRQQTIVIDSIIHGVNHTSMDGMEQVMYRSSPFSPHGSISVIQLELPTV